MFLLGAGFSKSVHDCMPTLPELRDLVLARLGADGVKPDLRAFQDDLEQWMSYLAADQPWLTDAENLQNRATFLTVAQEINAVVEERELLARQAHGMNPPDWLMRLVEAWSDTEVGIITFNYDLLVERALNELGRLGTLGDLYPLPLTTRFPAGSSAFLSSGPPTQPVPRLLKLHGSTNWRFGGSTAPVTEELYLTENRAVWDPASASPRSDAPREAFRFAHKIPLIIPPTGAKGGWYANLALRAQWRHAAEEIRRCEQLVVIGYSFPATDLLVRHLVAQHLPTTSRVEVVDLSRAPAAALSDLLRRPVVQRFDGRTAVHDFAVNHAGKDAH
ncbi:SIR2-like protein [Micromonospora endolithica]|nr:SIR2-like protein [Micromonospora endolithica]